MEYVHFQKKHRKLTVGFLSVFRYFRKIQNLVISILHFISVKIVCNLNTRRTMYSVSYASTFLLFQNHVR